MIRGHILWEVEGGQVDRATVVGRWRVRGQVDSDSGGEVEGGQVDSDSGGEVEGGQVDRATVVGRWRVARWIERQWRGGGGWSGG